MLYESHKRRIVLKNVVPGDEPHGFRHGLGESSSARQRLNVPQKRSKLYGGDIVCPSKNMEKGNMGNIYGYVRVSTAEQNVDRQVLAMCDKGIPEKNIIIGGVAILCLMGS
ncbi:MAG: hypothetical protein J5861_02595 [Desulfovibrio sp.]|nr:hypothetical protein [Desulfovibrio sp.]